MEFIQGRVWSVKRLSRLVPTNRVDTSGWEGGECGSQCSFGERRSVIEEILTGVMVRYRRTPT
jgi:hypothetical protein